MREVSSSIYQCQWLFLVPVKGGIGSIFHPQTNGRTISGIYKWYISYQLGDGICHLPPFTGTKNNHWLEMMFPPSVLLEFLAPPPPRAALALVVVVSSDGLVSYRWVARVSENSHSCRGARCWKRVRKEDTQLKPEKNNLSRKQTKFLRVFCA